MREIVLAISCFLAATAAHAASFDCQKARMKIEKMICGDAELSKLDEQLNSAYTAAVQDKTQAASVRQTQKQWLKARDTCPDLACLKQAYADRLQALSANGDSDEEPENCYACPSQIEAYMNQRRAEIRASLSKADAGLFDAIDKNDIAGVKKWLAKGANANAEQESDPEYMGGGRFQEGGSFTPLLAAASGKKREIVELLLAKGADVKAVSQDGDTPLSLATFASTPEVVQLLLDHGADIHIKTQNGLTLLHLAARSGATDNAELLIARGLDVDAQSDAGQTPLHEAARNTHPDTVKLLLAKGAQVDARDKNGITPLLEMMAYSLGTTRHDAEYKAGRLTETTRLLLANGADVNVRTERGATPLHFAHYKNVAELLLGKGADINAKDNYGNTPFHSLGLTNYDGEEMIELYLAKGGDINARNKEGKTPLDFAEERQKEIYPADMQALNADNVRLLKKHGAKE
jgi:ankyrin repeat protein/uncharacterized protein YecT (DUF1311 family)